MKNNLKDNHPTSFDGMTPTPAWAFAQYQRLRRQLPEVGPNMQAPQRIPSLKPLFSRFDAFVFDAFGVLNVGPKVIPGAVDRLTAVQTSGKPVLLLSNAATATQQALTQKYQSMGFDLTEDRIISSRRLLEESLALEPRRGLWGVIAPPESDSQSLPMITHQPVQPGISDQALDEFDGFIFLSSENWNETLQAQLAASLNRHKRPLDVANPDLVAPRGDCMTLEPGFFAHRLSDETGINPQFFGKPYRPAFTAALNRLNGISPERVLMVGDTLHTDILGARAAGMATLLVSDFGSLAGMDINACIEYSSISPDYIAPSI